MMLEEDIRLAAEAIRRGGSILYPTDTVWGIGCDARNEEAVRKIFWIKEREQERSLILLLDAKEKLPLYIEHCPEIICDLLDSTDRPLTVIYPGARNLAPSVIAADGSIAIRIVDHPFCTPLLRAIDGPLVSTSANISNQPTPPTFMDIRQEVLDRVDYVVSNFRKEIRDLRPSRILRFDEKGNFEIVRE